MDIAKDDPGVPGDGDAALEAALAAADESMLTGIAGSLDLDRGFAQVLRDLSGPSVSRPAVRPGQGREGKAAHGQGKTTTGSAVATLDVTDLICKVNASDETAKDQCLRARRASGLAAHSARVAELSAAAARNAATTHEAAQAGCPRRRAPLPRQMALVLAAAGLDGVACYIAAQALGESQDATLVWTGFFLAVLAAGDMALNFYRDRSQRAWRASAVLAGSSVALLGTLRFVFLAAAGADRLAQAIAGAGLFTAATAGFLTLGYRALRVSEIPTAWRARQKSRKAARAARAARAIAARDTAERNRLITAYLDQVRSLLAEPYPDEQQLLIEAAAWQYLLWADGNRDWSRGAVVSGLYHARDPASRTHGIAGDAAGLVLAVIETRSACITLSRVFTDADLVDAARCVRSYMLRAESMMEVVQCRARGAIRRVVAFEITDFLESATSVWEKAEEKLCRAADTGFRLAEIHRRLEFLEEPGIYSDICRVISDVGYAANRGNTLARALESSKAQAVSVAPGAPAFRGNPGAGVGLKSMLSGMRPRKAGMLINSLAADLRIVGSISKELCAAIPQCATRIPLRRLAEVQVDASGADLSAADFPDLDILHGVIWTSDTTWPPGIARRVRSRSRQIRPGVYQVCGRSERDLADLAPV